MLIPKKTRFVLGTMTVFVVLLARPALGEENTPVAPPPPTAAATAELSTKDELAQFGEFLDQNPSIEARLRENTALVSDQAFIKNRPQFAEHLDKHPNTRTELTARPRWFLFREFVRQSTPPVTPGQIAAFDQFLDLHPDLAEQLSHEPQLLGQPDFLGAHAELREYFKQHPEINHAAAPKLGNQPRRAGSSAPANRPAIRRGGGPKGR